VLHDYALYKSTFTLLYFTRTSFSLSLTLVVAHFILTTQQEATTAALADTAFYTTYAHSPRGDNATSLAECVLSECSCYFLFIAFAARCYE